MGYKIVKGATCWWPVVVPQAEEGGDVQEHEFEIRFRRVTDTREAAGWPKLKDKEFVLTAATDWRGLEDGDGPVPFTPERIAEMVRVPNLAAAIARAWFAFVNGEPARRLGNSAPPPDGGPAAAEATVAPADTPTS